MHYGVPITAAGGLGASSFNPAVGASVGVAALLGAIGLDKLKKSGLKNLLIDPKYRDIIASGNRKALDKLRLPHGLSVPAGVAKYLSSMPNALMQFGNRPYEKEQR
jgi:hypothetical protein